jgi:AcrR family transcriptional regulator
MAKPLERENARKLRKEGLPYKRIAARLGVSPGSVYLWTKDIELTEEQVAANLRGPGGPQNPEHVRRRAAAWAARCRAARAVSQDDGREAARTGDLLHLAGCMLYWAEGAKARNAVRFTNSDPHMLRFFRHFLVDALGIEPADIHMSINEEQIAVRSRKAQRASDRDGSAHLWGHSGVRGLRRAALARLQLLTRQAVRHDLGTPP